MNWPLVPLSQVSALINGDRGKNYPSGNDIVESGIRFINAGHIVGNSLSKGKMNYITQDRFELLRGGKIQRNDILFCLRGSLGKCVLIQDNEAGSIASSLVIIRANPEQINPVFLQWILRSSQFQRQIGLHDNGTAQPNLSAKNLAKFEIPLPPLEEQKRIAAILDKSDEIEAKTEKSNEIRAELSNSIFFDLFGDLSINPHDFPEYELSEIADFQEGPGILAVDFHDEGIPLLRLKGIENEFATLDGCNYLLPEKVELKWKHFCVQKGDILIGSSASVGRVSIVDDNTIGAIPYTGIIRFRINEKLVNQTFLLALLCSEVFIRQVTRMSTGSTIKHFGPTHLKKVRLPVPPLNLQNELEKLFSSLRGIETTDVLAKVNSQSLSQNLLS